MKKTVDEIFATITSNIADEAARHEVAKKQLEKAEETRAAILIAYRKREISTFTTKATGILKTLTRPKKGNSKFRKYLKWALFEKGRGMDRERLEQKPLSKRKVAGLTKKIGLAIDPSNHGCELINHQYVEYYAVIAGDEDGGEICVSLVAEADSLFNTEFPKNFRIELVRHSRDSRTGIHEFSPCVYYLDNKKLDEALPKLIDTESLIRTLVDRFGPMPKME